MRKQLETEIKVGLFVATGVGLLMLAVLLLGGTQNLFSGSYHYISHFSRVDGLIVGAKVILNGVPVGTVDKIHFDHKLRNIQVDFSVNKESRDWIRKDSTVEIATQGVLGDKYLSINAGTEENPVLPPESDLPTRPNEDIAHFISKGDQLMVSLNSIANSLNRILKSFEADNRSERFFAGISSSAKNLALMTDKMNNQLDHLQLVNAVGNLNQILEKVNNGTGTIGALINDPSLYDEFRSLMGGVNRNRIMRNLVRQTVRQAAEKNAGSEADANPTPDSK